jgi:kynurenine 3-monooxygenase
MNTQQKPIIILGAGLAGSLLGCFLAKRGFPVEIYERRDDMRKVTMSVGRSINLALSARGCGALKEVGLLDEILKISIPMYGRMIHNSTGEQCLQPYSRDGKSAILSVSRGELNCQLMTLAEKNHNIQINFNRKCSSVDFKTRTVTFINEETGQRTEKQGLNLIGADGAYSIVREKMMHLPRFDYSQSFIAHGYKELRIPPGLNGKHLLEKNALHIWPRGSFMMIALPNMDGSFTCTCFFPYEGDNGFNHLDNAPDEILLKFFERDFPDAVPLMPTLLEDWRANPTSTLMTVRCYPWSVRGATTLIGDSAHAIVPFFGQVSAFDINIVQMTPKY